MEGSASLNKAKEILAYELTSMVHGKEEAEKAQDAARALFGGSAMDTEHMPSTQLTEADLTDGSIGILTLMVKCWSGSIQRRGTPSGRAGRCSGGWRKGSRSHRWLHC